MLHNREAIPTGVEQGGELSPEKGERSRKSSSLASQRRQGTKNAWARSKMLYEGMNEMYYKLWDLAFQRSASKIYFFTVLSTK
jgi:hypothetical protein